VLATRHLIDASEVYPRLFQGSRPLPNTVGHFDLVVLAAMEYQPSHHDLGAKAVVHSPLDDGPPMTPEERRRAVSAAMYASHSLRSGGSVLVTCWQGLNRSGLITALTLVVGKKMRVDEAVRLVRRARGQNALTNPHFLNFLARASR
jgi:protein-tyrosine phosphatase